MTGQLSVELEGRKIGYWVYSRCAAWRLDMALRADIEDGRCDAVRLDIISRNYKEKASYGS